jgi:predicted nucleotidyltransferase component of viral defense system
VIRPGEIQQIARTEGVRDTQIEKDYILSWVLWAIAGHEQLSKSLVFKGGTVLKKVYFNPYRFSEDLDFTLLNKEITNKKLFEWFELAFDKVRQTANIPLRISDSPDDHERIPDNDNSINFFINYTGPLGGHASSKHLKVDITRDEQLVFYPHLKPAFIDYTDLEPYHLLCYTLEEILMEKMRSVIQRMQARDFYDIWYLLEVEGIEPGFIMKEFEIKCKTKQIHHVDFPVKLADRLPQYKARWHQSLKDQMKELPDFERVVREVNRHFKKINL